jgi:7tm Odorant receptor
MLNFGLQTLTSVIVILVSHIFVQYKSMIICIRNLDELIRQNIKGSQNEKIKKNLASIVKDYVELTEYATVFNELFSLVYFVEYITNILVIATFLTELSIHPEQVGDILALTVTLSFVFCSCLLGSMLEVQHDEYCNALYELSWVDLPVKQQKWILLMLAASNQRSLIECGIWEYNLEIFQSMCKSGYSYFNILLTLKKNKILKNCNK